MPLRERQEIQEMLRRLSAWAGESWLPSPTMEPLRLLHILPLQANSI
jgi:hypothetical protein